MVHKSIGALKKFTKLGMECCDSERFAKNSRKADGDVPVRMGKLAKFAISLLMFRTSTSLKGVPDERETTPSVTYGVKNTSASLLLKMLLLG